MEPTARTCYRRAGIPVEDQRRDQSTSGDLARWFADCGYVRRYDEERRRVDGQSYKKGFEVRFVLKSVAELRVIRRVIRAAGFRPGKPFRKHSRLVQPVYGRPAVERLVGADEECGTTELATRRRTTRRSGTAQRQRVAARA